MPAAPRKTEKISANTLASVAELSAVLGVTSTYIYKLAQDGVISSAQRGKYPLADSVQRYIAYLGRDAVTEDEVKLDKVKRTAEAQLKASKAKIASMEAQELEGKMHRSEDVAAMTEDLIYEIRGALIALPGRLAVDVAACGSAAEAAEIVRREVHQIMGELAGYQYDPDRYAERVRERMKWDAEVVTDDE
ncbi:MAG: hypothetical protein K2P33_02695 [Acutalibacter sp.]|nr:hypothetical protein [Acutalibacter sp.]